MNAFVSVLIDFPIQDFPGLVDRFDSVPYARSDQMILNPAVRSFYLSLGGRTQGIDDFNTQILQNFLPLNDGIFFFDVSLLPDGVSSFDKSEDRMVINVIL